MSVTLAAAIDLAPVLIVAYHFAPDGRSSGVLRSLKFSKYLPRYGWQPHILTLRESCYPVRDEGLLRDIPAQARVHRTRALETSLRLGSNGRRLSLFEVPDAGIGWLPFALARGRKVIRQAGIRAIYSTSPLPTAHLVAGALKQVTGVPWIADFRDPWIEEGIHPQPGSLRYRLEAALESFVVRHADRVTLTTERLRREMLSRYRGVPPEQFTTIYNGYDEEDFSDLPLPPPDFPTFELLHAGFVTPEYRDPMPLLRAVRACADRGDIDLEYCRLVFVGGGDFMGTQAFVAMVREFNLGAVVQVVDRISYQAMLERMTRAAVLLLMQASDDTKPMIPAKVFEYLRIGRPVFAMVFDGATVDLMNEIGRGIVADPRDASAVESAIVTLYRRWQARSLSNGEPSRAVRRFERSSLTGELAMLLNAVGGVSVEARTFESMPQTAALREP
jgi:glycosyltransferase involved in cell wall biosynthesis